MFISWPAKRSPSDRYHRVDVGDVNGLVEALHAMEFAIMSEHEFGDVQSALCAITGPKPDKIRASAIAPRST